jgi:hypothetical protein
LAHLIGITFPALGQFDDFLCDKVRQRIGAIGEVESFADTFISRRHDFDGFRIAACWWIVLNLAPDELQAGALSGPQPPAPEMASLGR